MHASGTGSEAFETAGVELSAGQITGLFTIRSASTAGLAAARLEASIAAADLLRGREDETERICRIEDHEGRVLGTETGSSLDRLPERPDCCSRDQSSSMQDMTSLVT